MSLAAAFRRGSVVPQLQSRLRTQFGGRPRKFSSSNMTPEEKQEAIKNANDVMKGYVETRILAKQGKLKSKRKTSQSQRSQNVIQISLFLSLSAAFIVSPWLGKKIATDEEFRNKYVPSWYPDFRVKTPDSAWTRQELHEQIVQVEKDMRERAIRGDFTPDKLEVMKGQMEPRSDLSEDDVAMADKYGWGRLHPGVDPDDFDDDEDD
jgi:hypothetical protein